MQTLQIDKANARKLYAKACPEFRQMLLDTFGEAFFTQKITDRVQTFDDILEISGRTMADITAGCWDKQEVANRKAKLIAEVYNEETVLDPNDTNQYKYYPWFEITPRSGFGLSCHVYAGWHTNTCVGVRLCFKNKDLAIDAGKKFTDIYADLLIN